MPVFDSVPQMLNMASIWGVLSGILLANSRARIVLESDALQIRNLLIKWTIPWGRVIAVQDANGLQILTADSRKIGVFAYGSSVLAGLSGNRRARALASTIRQRILEDRAVTSAQITRSFNWELIVLPLLTWVAYVVAGVLARQYLHSQ